MISRPLKFFLTYWFLEILGTVLYISREMSPAAVTTAFLGHALLLMLSWGKMFLCYWCPIQRWDKRPSYRFSKKDHRNWLHNFHIPHGWRREWLWREDLVGRIPWESFAVSLISFSRVMADCQWDQWIFPVVNGGHSVLVSNSSFRKLDGDSDSWNRQLIL